MTLKIKSAQYGQQPDFRDVGFRRLTDALTEMQTRAGKALERMNEYMSSGRLDLSLQDIQKDQDLMYLLPLVLGNDWQKLVTGSMI